MKNSQVLNFEDYERGLAHIGSTQTLESALLQNQAAQHAQELNTSVKEKYFRFLNDNCQESKTEARHFIQTQLDKISKNCEDLNSEYLPRDYAELKTWISDNAEEVGQQYHQYLIERASGKPRRLFKNKSHALNFLKLVAPTKMVDGAWLHGFINHPNEERFAKLINIYLDELGNGDVHKNHVVLFRQLLTKYGFEDLADLPDALFVQGAIQLALGCNTDAFAPEIIGFNLAYEQLPLHLMITAYELKELNIDPYYFTLHITVDNALTGHSKQAIDAFRDCLPKIGNQEDYFKRVISGMALNQDGLSTMSIIGSYDIDNEIVEIFKQKSTLGKYMHGDHCSIGGKTVNTWLADPQDIPEFLQALQKNNWITRHEDPKNSRFWKLIESDKAVMFGVFSQYEKQVIYDWIAGTALETLPRVERLGQSINIFARKELTKNVANQDIAHNNALTIQPSNIIKMELAKKTSVSQASNQVNESKPNNLSAIEDETLFNSKVERTKDKAELLTLLTHWMSPANHHSHLGLIATRFYIAHLDDLR